MGMQKWSNAPFALILRARWHKLLSNYSQQLYSRDKLKNALKLTTPASEQDNSKYYEQEWHHPPRPNKTAAT